MSWGSFWLGVALLPAMILAVAIVLGIIYLTVAACAWFLYRWRIRFGKDEWWKASWAARFAVNNWFLVSPHPRIAVIFIRKGQQHVEPELTGDIEKLLRKHNGAKASYL